MSKKLLLILSLTAAILFTFGAAQSDAWSTPGGSGDLLLGQFYDVRDTAERAGTPWENYFTIRNTSDVWVAAHLRFRAQTKSIEVWDHIILLSPHDVFWLDLQRGYDGGVTMYSADTITLKNSGWIRADETEFSGTFDTALLVDLGFGDGALAELEMGYIEVIGVWSINNQSHSILDLTGDTYDDPDDPGAINVYDLLVDMWGDIGGGRTRGDRPDEYGETNKSRNEFEDCPNVLQGEMEMGDVVTGAYQLENFVAVSWFRTSDPTFVYHRDRYDGSDGGVIGYPVELLFPAGRCYTDGLAPTPGQNIAWYLNPGVNTTVGPTLLDGDSSVDFSPDPFDGFNSPWSLFELEFGLSTFEKWAYYMNSEVGDAPFDADIKTDVVLTFPTKHHHFFFTGWPYWNGDGNNYLLCGIYWQEINNFRAGIKTKWDGINNAPCFIEGMIWDTEQNSASLSPGPSPNPWNEPYLPHEVNVVSIGDEGILKTDFVHGQFMLTKWVFPDDQRTIDPYFCELPMLGLTIRNHYMGTGPVRRSAMTSMQYKW